MIKGKKVELIGVSHDDLESMRLWRNEPELRKYFREHKEITREMQHAWWFKASVDPNQYNFAITVEGYDDLYKGFAIYEDELDVPPPHLIGHCGLYYIDWRARKAEFGIYIGDRAYRNGGFGSDALRTLIGYGFNTLNLNKIWCEVYSNNKSIELYKRLGFKHEGTLKDTYYDDGEFHDGELLALFKKDWKQQ